MTTSPGGVADDLAVSGGTTRSTPSRARRLTVRTIAVATAAVVLGLATAGVAATLGAPATDDAAVGPVPPTEAAALPECPPSVPDLDDAWVPSLPVFDGADSALAPPDAVAGIVCTFAPRAMGGVDPTGADPAAPGALTGQTVLDGALARATAVELSAVPFDIAGVCTAMMSYGVPSLIGLLAADGTTTWVRTGGHCTDSTNGTFTTGVRLELLVSSLTRDGALPVLPSDTDPCQPGSGRHGQSGEIVPGVPTSVTICTGGTVVTVSEPQVLGGLVTELRALERMPDRDSCQVLEGGTFGPSYTLRFHYDAGPDAWVMVHVGCDPAVGVPGSQARTTPHLNELLAAAVAG